MSIFCSKQNSLEKLTGFCFTYGLFEHVGGGAALFKETVNVYSRLFLLCRLVGDLFHAGAKIFSKMLYGQLVHAVGMVLLTLL